MSGLMRCLCALVLAVLVICGPADARPAPPGRRLAQQSDPTAPFFGSIFNPGGGSGGGGSPGAKPAVSCITAAPNLCPPLYSTRACCTRSGDGPTDCSGFSGSCPAGKSAFCCS